MNLQIYDLMKCQVWLKNLINTSVVKSPILLNSEQKVALLLQARIKFPRTMVRVRGGNWTLLWGCALGAITV